MSPVVVVDDVSSVVRTIDVDRIRNGRSGIHVILETQHSVLFVARVRHVHRESKKKRSIKTVFIYGEISKVCMFLLMKKTTVNKTF